METLRCAPELTERQRYTAAGIFTVAIHARQGRLLQAATEVVEKEVLRPNEKDKQLISGAQVASLGEAEGFAKLAVTLDSKIHPVKDELALAGTEELCEFIYKRLGVYEKLWQGLLETATVNEGRAVREVLSLFISPLCSEGPLELQLDAVLRHLTAATFSWGLVQPGEEVGPDAPPGQKGSRGGAADLPTLPKAAGFPTTRWHDARAAQALRDLSRWLQAWGGPQPGRVEAWQAEDATCALTGKAELDAEDMRRSSKWTLNRALAVGGTAVVGGTLLAVTGGLAAPAIAAGLTSAASLLGGTAAAGVVSGVATTTAVTATMGATGAGYGGRAMMRRTGEVREFDFLPVSRETLPGGAYVVATLEVRPGADPSEHRVAVSLSVSDPNAEEKKSPRRDAFVKGLTKVFQRGAAEKNPRASGWFPWTKGKGRASSAVPKAPAPDGDGGEGSGRPGSPRRDDAWRNWKPPGRLPLPWPKALKAQIAPECTVCVAGWVRDSPAGFVSPFDSLVDSPGAGRLPEPEVYCLVWESDKLIALHNAIMSLVTSYAAGQLSKHFVTTFVNASLVAAVSVPATILAATSVIDNSWSIVLDRADKAGLILAQRLVSTAPASRPVRLVGFSMGARLIFSCLLELARCGHRGVVSEVVLVGAPVSITPMKWCSARSAVAGRFVNGFCSHDWLLGMVYRTSRAFAKNAAGLQPVGAKVPEAYVEDVDLLELGIVKGHTDYPQAMGRILEHLGSCED